MRFDAVECGKRERESRLCGKKKDLPKWNLLSKFVLLPIICGLLNTGGELVLSTCW